MLVTVIIPAFNAENYIADCLESVFNQSYSNLEIIVINDGSTDSTHSILESMSDKRLIVFHQTNSGCSSAKNLGLFHAHGDYIQYLDADDLLSSDKIEKQVFALRTSKNTIAVCRTCIFQRDINIIEGEIDTLMLRKEGTGLQFLLRLFGADGRFGMVQPNAYLIPKEIANKVGGWNIDISPSPDEDGEYFTRALLVADHVIFTEGINYYRKINNNKSLSQVYSLQRVSNLLNTIELKFSHVFSVKRNRLTQRLFLYNVSQFAYQFALLYPVVVDYSEKTLRNNGFKKFKFLNNSTMNFLVFFFGNKLAINLLVLYRKLRVSIGFL
jgi:glycosyltransferase involved in cell wall biosynthesis